MNKTALAILLALTPAALYVVFALLNPLPPVSAMYVGTVNSFATSLLAPVQGLFGNPAVLATASGTASGLVVNYVRGKMQKTALGQAEQITHQVEQENKSLYQTLGMGEQKILDLQKEADKVSELETKVTDQQETIKEQDLKIQRMIWEKAGLDKKDKDEIKKDVLQEMRKP